MKKIKYASYILYLFVILPACQSGRQPSTSEKGFHSERIDRISQVIEESVQNGEIPGAVVLFAINGEIIFHESYGYADLASEKPMERNSIFRIASMTKAITTTGVMILYERGHFLLNDPISKFIPEFKNPNILVEIDSDGNVIETRPSNKEIRIIDLLTHTSGIGYPFLPTQLQSAYKMNGIIDAVTDQNTVLRNQMLALSKMPLLFEPGSQFQYGLSIDLLGYLCEVISGKSLDQFFKDEIFTPLKMEDTQFYLTENEADRLVTLYSWVNGQGLIESTGNESPIIINNPKFPIEGAKSYFSGGGGLSSTVYDYWRFTQMLLNNGELEGTQILSRKSVELMKSPRTDADKDGKKELALGFSVINDIAQVGELGTDGSYFGAGAFYGMYWIDPEEKLTAVFMSQVLPSNTKVALRFRTMVYQALK